MCHLCEERSYDGDRHAAVNPATPDKMKPAKAPAVPAPSTGEVRK